MKRLTFLSTVVFSLLIVSNLFITGCSKDDDTPSNTDLLCRTWVWGEEDLLMRFQSDGTAVLNDGNTGTFNFLWRWGNKDETQLVLTYVKSGKVEKYIVVSITDKELVLKDETGSKQITIYAA